MSTTIDTGSATDRRNFLARGILGGAAVLAPARLAGQAPLRLRHARPGAHGAAAVPPAVVCLADFGGAPGAPKAVLVEAFRQGFATLAQTGGGTLVVLPGTYDFGEVDEPAALILCRDLHDVVISAYGAVFRVDTTAPVMPSLFYFFNFRNVTLAGASFVDLGFTPWIDWQGMYCVGIQADRPSSGFRMIDCLAERVVGLFASNNNASTRHLLSDIHIDGEVRHAYYGVGASYIRENVSVTLACHNVRRAFIAYALKNCDIAVNAFNTADWPGSNGFVALVCAGARLGNVENVQVRVAVSGVSIHASYVHFYHQGPQAEGAMRDIDATVNALRMRPMRCLFLFDHETYGVQPTTARLWDRIALHGGMDGIPAGDLVANTSVSTAQGTVRLDRSLVRAAGKRRLAPGFRIDPS